MSMYNMLHGQNPMSVLIISMLGIQPARFRDSWITKDGEVAIYTRLGGGNRECWCMKGEEHSCYQENIKKLQGHPNYLYDRDDDFDSTYATFYFSFPEKYMEIFEAMPREGESGDERWAKKLEEIKYTSPEALRNKYPEMCNVLDEIVKKVGA